MFVESILLIAMFVVFGGLLLLGFHVAYVLFGVSVLFTGVAIFADNYLDTATGLDFEFFGLVVERIYGLMTNWILIAGTTFIFMGNMLDKSGIAERLLSSTQELFGNVRRRHGGYCRDNRCHVGGQHRHYRGIGCSACRIEPSRSWSHKDIRRNWRSEPSRHPVVLGIIIPPSIMLVFMADQLGLPAGDLFMGAVFPGFILAGLYIVYILI